MKHLIKCATLVFFLFFIVGLFSLHARIWRVNNNPGIAADFTTLAEVHNAASSGDTIHIEGSPTGYGDLTCSKKLIIIGPGYFLAENPHTQAILHSAKVGTFNVFEGSDGTEIMGLDFGAQLINISCNNIIVRKNQFTELRFGEPEGANGHININNESRFSSKPASNIIISQNYGVAISVNFASTDILISNNYIGIGAINPETSTANSLTINDKAVILVQNNIFRRGKITAFNCTFMNNIMVAGFFEGTGNIVSHNLANGTQFGTENGNQSNVAMSTVFVGLGTGISRDAQWELKAGSPAAGAGSGSTAQNPIDAGMFENPYEYTLSGLPSIPSVYFFESEAVGNSSDPINVTIKIISNQN